MPQYEVDKKEMELLAAEDLSSGLRWQHVADKMVMECVPAKEFSSETMLVE